MAHKSHNLFSFYDPAIIRKLQHMACVMISRFSIFISIFLYFFMKEPDILWVTFMVHFMVSKIPYLPLPILFCPLPIFL